MNVKINCKQKSAERTTGEQMSNDRCLTKINSWRAAWWSLLTKFFADENFLLYSSWPAVESVGQSLSQLVSLRVSHSVIETVGESSSQSISHWVCRTQNLAYKPTLNKSRTKKLKKCTQAAVLYTTVPIHLFCYLLFSYLVSFFLPSWLPLYLSVYLPVYLFFLRNNYGQRKTECRKNV